MPHNCVTTLCKADTINNTVCVYTLGKLFLTFRLFRFYQVDNYMVIQFQLKDASIIMSRDIVV